MVRNPHANIGDAGSISGSQISPGGGNANPLQCSCLGNPMDRRAWWTSLGVKKELDMTENAHTHTYTHTHTYSNNTIKSIIKQMKKINMK